MVNVRNLGLAAGLAGLLATSGCSSTKLTGTAPVDGYNGQSLLTLVGFTGSVVRTEKRFAGYSKTARRISLIDPSGEREVWGRQLDGAYDLTMPLPNYSGVALLQGNTLSLASPDAIRTFTPIEFDVGYFARAQNAATYVAVSQDATKFHVIRQLAGGDWQEETILSPWEDESGYSAPPAEEPPLAVALLSGDGSQMVLFRPADGRYAYFRAADAGQKIEPDAVGLCPGDGDGTPGRANFRTIAFDDGQNLVYTGDKRGRISVFDPKLETCTTVANRPVLNLGDGLALTDINVVSGGKVLVTQAGARAHSLSVTAAGFQDVVSYTGLCDYPLGALPAGKDSLAVVCFAPENFDPVAEKSTAPARVNYRSVAVQLVNVATGLPTKTLPLALDGVAGMALDGDSARILTLKDSAIGVLDVLDLKTGASHSKKGLFLGGILD